jgi:hypothetical protein
MYQIVGRTVIFDCNFDQELNDIILNDIALCDKIIFNDYEDLNICLITNNKWQNKYNYEWIGSKFNQSLSNLPYRIRDLTLGSEFNKPLDNLPSSITNLTLGFTFNRCLDNLPHGIINLTLGTDFNQSIDNLPSSIENLTLGTDFNQSIDNLPSSIKNLTLGTYFNQCLDNLPHSIRNLTLGTYFNQCLDNLPNNLCKITFKTYNDLDIKFNKNIKKIPQNLKTIDLSQIPHNPHLIKEFKKFNVEILTKY